MRRFSLLPSNALYLVSKRFVLLYSLAPYFVGARESKIPRDQSNGIEGIEFTPFFPAHTLETHYYTKFIAQV